jgi:hypothetical protein
VRFCRIESDPSKNNSFPFQHLITFPEHILSTPSASSPILARSPPSGTASGVVCGREGNGALRRVIDEITRPGRLCPRVPRRHYGRLCRTEHCTELEPARRKCRGDEGEGSGTDAAFRTPDRVRGFAIHCYLQGRTTRPVFPRSFNDQTRGAGVVMRSRVRHHVSHSHHREIDALEQPRFFLCAPCFG